MVALTKSVGKTPDKTLDRTMQDLRDAGIIAFVKPGVYRILVDQGEVAKLLSEYAKSKVSAGERFMARLLTRLGIKYQTEYSFRDYRAVGRLRFDFYFEIANQKYAIECDGRQHQFACEHFGGIPQMIGQNIRDKVKNAYAAENGIILLRLRNSLDPDTKELRITAAIQLSLRPVDENSVGSVKTETPAETSGTEPVSDRRVTVVDNGDCSALVNNPDITDGGSDGTPIRVLGVVDLSEPTLDPAGQRGDLASKV